MRGVARVIPGSAGFLLASCATAAGVSILRELTFHTADGEVPLRLGAGALAGGMLGGAWLARSWRDLRGWLLTVNLVVVCAGVLAATLEELRHSACRRLLAPLPMIESGLLAIGSTPLAALVAVLTGSVVALLAAPGVPRAVVAAALLAGGATGVAAAMVAPEARLVALLATIPGGLALLACLRLPARSSPASRVRGPSAIAVLLATLGVGVGIVAHNIGGFGAATPRQDARLHAASPGSVALLTDVLCGMADAAAAPGHTWFDAAESGTRSPVWRVDFGGARHDLLTMRVEHSTTARDVPPSRLRRALQRCRTALLRRGRLAIVAADGRAESVSQLAGALLSAGERSRAARLDVQDARGACSLLLVGPGVREWLARVAFPSGAAAALRPLSSPDEAVWLQGGGQPLP